MPSPSQPIKQHSSLFISVSSSKSNYPCHSTARYRRKSAGCGFLILTALILLCLGITTTDWLLSTTAMLSKSLASLRLLKMQDDAAGTAAAATATALTDDDEPVVKNSTSTTTSSLSIFEILSRKRQAFWKDTVLQQEIQANVDCRGKEEFLSILYAAGIVTNKIKRNYPVQQQPTTTTFDISSVKNVTILSTPHRAQYQSWLLETCPKLAPWSDVTELYGSQPVVIGMETCARYRQSAMAYNNNNNTPLVGFIRVAGLYNSGTNALQTTLQRNLYRLSHAAKHVPLLQVPWGKHLPVKYKYQNVHPVFHQQQQQKRNDGIGSKNPGLVLPIVLVRDPYQWAQSMCKHSYDANISHCPNFVRTRNDDDNEMWNQPTSSTSFVSTDLQETNTRTSTRIKTTTYSVTLNYHAGRRNGLQDGYPSLADMWSTWHRDYLTFTNNSSNVDVEPRLLVRFEDLLFHAEEVFSKILACVGVTPESWMATARRNGEDGSFKYTVGKTKAQDHVDFMGALLKYGRNDDHRDSKAGGSSRIKGMTRQDLVYAATGTMDGDNESSSSTLFDSSSSPPLPPRGLDPKLMEMFRYRHPTF